MNSKKDMTFLDHLEELRRVLLKACIAVLLGAGLSLVFSPQIYQWLQGPLQQALPPNSHFIITSPFEAYLTYFKIALVFGIFLASPLIFFLFWSFVRPGLKKEEKKGIIPIALLSSALFVGGALFGYFVVFPTGFHFAVKILQHTDILLFPKMSDYLSLALRLLIAFGIIFELPLILYLLGRFGLVKAEGLRRSRKYVVVGIVLLAGILTPGPDVFSQLLMALPLLLLFEVGILLVKWTTKRQELSEKLAEDNT